MYRVYLIFWGELVADTFVNPPFSTSFSYEVQVFNSRWSHGSLESSTAADPDFGPYCYIDSTTGNLTTGIFASSGFVVTNAACRSTCSQAGCSLSRESPFGSGSYSLMSQCAVAEAFHYAVAGSQRESKCPYVDMNVSKFLFRGTQYIVQWYWLGWPTLGDCMNAVLCGPTSVYFDASQGSTLRWCQPTPKGFHSPQCSNQLLPCDPPPNIGDMSLAYWTSHGFGKPDGCSAEMVALAAISGTDISAVLNPTTFTILATITTIPPSSILSYPSWTILFGTFLSFFVGIRLTTPSTAIISFFHASLTVGPFDTWIETPELPWFFAQPTSLAVSYDGIRVNIFVNSMLVSTVPSPMTSLHSIGTLSPTSLIPSNWTSLVHIGPIFVTSSQFQAATTGGINPYDFWSRESFLDFSVSDIRIVEQVLTTTTIPPVFTTSSISTTVSILTTTAVLALTSDSTTTESHTQSTSLISESSSGSTTFTILSDTQATEAKIPAEPIETGPGLIVLISLAAFFVTGLAGFFLWRYVSNRQKRRRSESIEVPLTGWHFNDITLLSTDLNNSMWRHP